MKATRITVSDRDGTIVALATEIWGISIIFLIQGASFHRPPDGDRKPHSNVAWYHVSRGSIIINVADLNLLNFVDLQILSSREVDSGCREVYLNNIRLSIIVVFITDIILLSIMPFGLYRLRCHGGGTMALGSLLWNRVIRRQCLFLLTTIL
jgi:hypothetical protein